MGRVFKIYCEEVSDDGSEFKLVFEVDGKVEKEQLGLYSFDDVLIVSYSFFTENLTEYKFDGRFDRYEVKIEYNW
jgi:hypothetical protein